MVGEEAKDCCPPSNFKQKGANETAETLENEGTPGGTQTQGPGYVNVKMRRKNESTGGPRRTGRQTGRTGAMRDEDDVGRSRGATERNRVDTQSDERVYPEEYHVGGTSRGSSARARRTGDVERG